MSTRVINTLTLLGMSVGSQALITFCEYRCFVFFFLLVEINVFNLVDMVVWVRSHLVYRHSNGYYESIQTPLELLYLLTSQEMKASHVPFRAG